MSKPTNIYELLGEDQGEEEKQTPNKKAQATQAKQPAPTTTGKGVATKKTAPVVAPPPSQTQKENTARKDKAPASSSLKNLPPKKLKEIPDSGEKRPFDRRSGTGRPKTENKKGGGGKGNWGTLTEELSVQELQPISEVPVSEPKEQEIPQEQKEQKEQKTEVQEVSEEEDKTLTLSEYKKKQKSKKLPKVTKTRQPGEGEDPNAWKEYVPLVRDSEDGLVVKKQTKEAENKENKEGKEAENKHAKKESEKVPVHEVLNIQPKQSFRGRGNRGGRGGHRDQPKEYKEGEPREQRGGRGGNRGGFRGNRRGSNAQFNFSEENFPALTTKA